MDRARLRANTLLGLCALVAHDILHFKGRLFPQPTKHSIVDKGG